MHSGENLDRLRSESRHCSSLLCSLPLLFRHTTRSSLPAITFRSDCFSAVSREDCFPFFSSLISRPTAQRSDCETRLSCLLARSGLENKHFREFLLRSRIPLFSILILFPFFFSSPSSPSAEENSSLGNRMLGLSLSVLAIASFTLAAPTSDNTTSLASTCPSSRITAAYWPAYGKQSPYNIPWKDVDIGLYFVAVTTSSGFALPAGQKESDIYAFVSSAHKRMSSLLPLQT